MSAPEKHSAKTRIVVLEEHPLLRHGIAHFLNSQEDMIVCGETDNIRDARHKIHECKPHLLLTALRLGTGDSLEFLKALKSERPALLILVYSAFEETIFAERAFRAGAEGYVMKKAPKEELLTAIREILSGNIYVSHDVAMRAFKKSLETRSKQQRIARPTISIEKLSNRGRIFFLKLRPWEQIAHSVNLVSKPSSHRENIKRTSDLSCSAIW
jgi:DNA-binding NarL/FixJ family response regulator